MGLAGDRGYVTAEAALVIPALVLFAALLVWALMAAAAQIRCVDAARAGARAAARSEPGDTAVGAAKAAAPPGGAVARERAGGRGRGRVAARGPGRGGGTPGGRGRRPPPRRGRRWRWSGPATCGGSV
ncbi:TadE family type IV pilus minor pilin [Streptomyces goshikiensis]|uniref:TadE family type IV pilus minor pilin n=1 Tax=Streptomyces goshikiensis TaxID=1942 RepID=UPI0036A0EB48